MNRLHGNAEAYWEYQYRYANEILFPLLAQWNWSCQDRCVLEVGCSEAGILQAFADAGASVTGVEISPGRIESARALQKTPFPVLLNDICNPDGLNELNSPFDLIILRDVIEHLFDRDVAMRNLSTLLAERGRVLVTFPPWYMPFGGHQQVLKTLLRKIPWLHLLPLPLYNRLIRSGVQGDRSLYQDLINTRTTGLTIRAFRRLLKRTGFVVDREIRWLVNPAYSIKFGLTARAAGILGSMPFLNEIAVSSVYAFLRRESE
jgi:SAM-dependent methyltransferase